MNSHQTGDSFSQQLRSVPRPPSTRRTLPWAVAGALVLMAGLAPFWKFGWPVNASIRALSGLVDIASYRQAKILGESLDPILLENHAVLWGRILRLNSDLVLAGDSLKKANPADPLWHEVEMERALLRLENGELADNLEFVLRLANVDSNQRDRIYEGVVRAYFRQLLPGPARELLKRWQSERPGLLYHLEAAHLQDFLDDSEGCLSELEIARKLAPTNPEIAGWIGKCQAALQQNQNALEHLEQALGQVPGQTDWQLALAVVLERVGQPEQAVGQLTAILERDANDGQALAERGRIHLLTGQPARARTDLELALRAEPGNTIAADNLRKALFELGKTEEARTLALRIPQMEKDQKRIKELIQVEIQKKPNDPDVMHELAAIFLRSGYPKSAVFWVRKALIIAPNHIPSNELMAGYYEATGNPGLAAEHRQKTLAHSSGPKGPAR